MSPEEQLLQKLDAIETNIVMRIQALETVVGLKADQFLIRQIDIDAMAARVMFASDQLKKLRALIASANF